MDQLIDTAHGDTVCQTIRASCGPGQTIAFVSGNFNVVHPGHLRLLKFAAEQADILVVGVNPDSTPGVTLPQEMRLDNVRSIALVHHAVRLDESASDFIAKLQPSVVVKGKEFEDRSNPEQEAVDAYGGRLIFSSGELRFASLSLLERDANIDISTVRKPLEFPKRHGFEISDLKSTARQAVRACGLLVIGDLIVDEYVTCDAVGMSQEDPTIVVTPLMTRPSSAAPAPWRRMRTVSAPMSSSSTLVGEDEVGRFARDTLEQHGVICDTFADETRPTTRKQRFRALNKTLLRVNHLRQHAARRRYPAPDAAMRSNGRCKTAILLLFSCFNYGCLPQDLVDAIADRARSKGVMMAADSQVSSQTGDVSRFKGMTLFTPTEREARVALNDFDIGPRGHQRAADRKGPRQEPRHHARRRRRADQHDDRTASSSTDRLPAFNPSPKDVSGAGDSFFMASSMALRVGADIWQSLLSRLARGRAPGLARRQPAADHGRTRHRDRRDRLQSRMTDASHARAPSCGRNRQPAAPLTDTIPKCLVHDPRPAAARLLARAAVRRRHRARAAQHALACGPGPRPRGCVALGVRASISCTRTNCSGPAARCWPTGTGLQARPFCVAHADNLTDFDVRGFIAAHRNRPAGHVMTHARLPDRRSPLLRHPGTG